MSIAAQCAACCTCPTATVEWDSRSASLTKCGFAQYIVTDPPKVYLSRTVYGYYKQYFCCTSTPPSFRILAVDSTVTGTADMDPLDNCESCDSDEQIETYTYNCAGSETSHTITTDPSFRCDKYFTTGVLNTVSATSETTLYGETNETFSDGDCIDDVSVDGSETWTLSNEYTTSLIQTNINDAFPSYDDDWNDTAGSYANLSTDELTYSARESRYRIRFLIPTANTAKNFRASWVERFIAEGGVGVSTVSVYSPGVYRPTVTLSAPPSGGTQAYAIAVMSSTGTVSSIAILNPGSGYVSAPTVTVQSASGGGTSSTGWTATLTTGTVTAIAGGSAGNYRPTLAFSSGGGSGATATCTLDSVGGIASVTVTAGGSAYTSEPTLTITPKVTGSTAADLLIHMGTETARCTIWSGTTPGGYVAGTPSTWPILPSASPYYFELPVPVANGTTLVANLRTACDGSSC